jgi:branched-chain amino acid transport system substrate-binding protein
MKLSPETSRRGFLALAVAAALLAGCRPSGDSRGGRRRFRRRCRTIVVGEFASLTGTEATFGKSSHEGTLLAIEELNKAGGILGEAVQPDHRGQPLHGRRIGDHREEVHQPRPRGGGARRGRLGSFAWKPRPFANRRGIPMVSPSSTNPKVTEIGDYIFRVCFIDPFQGKLLADFANQDAQGQEGRRALRRLLGI